MELNMDMDRNRNDDMLTMLVNDIMTDLTGRKTFYLPDDYRKVDEYISATETEGSELKTEVFLIEKEPDRNYRIGIFFVDLIPTAGKVEVFTKHGVLEDSFRFLPDYDTWRYYTDEQKRNS